MEWITATVSPEVATEILRDVQGEGGFQDLLRKLQRQFDPRSRLLRLDETDLERIPRYLGYEPGGYEQRLAALVRHLRSEGLIANDLG